MPSCRDSVQATGAKLTFRPWYTVWFKEEAIFVTCSEPDRKTAVVLPAAPSIRRGPESASHGQPLGVDMITGLGPCHPRPLTAPSRSVDID